MKLKSLLLFFALGLVGNVFGGSNNVNFASYWTGWSGPEIDLSQLSPNVSRLNISFANIDPTTLKPVGSNGILDSTQVSYKAWTQFKLNHPQVKMLLSFGGSSYANLWKTTLTSANAATIAKNIAAVINNPYPVYQSGKQNVAGSVSLDGVDLDVEAGDRVTAEQANNVVMLIQALRQELPNKLIVLTGISTAADPASCVSAPGDSCSYTYSPHSGELLPVLTQVSGMLDSVNDMAYDAGRNYNYQLSLANYAQYVEKSKVNLGLDLESQWDQTANFLESLDELNKRAAWAKADGYGAFVWALGATGGTPAPYPLNQQLGLVNQLASK